MTDMCGKNAIKQLFAAPKAFHCIDTPQAAAYLCLIGLTYYNLLKASFLNPVEDNAISLLCRQSCYLSMPLLGQSNGSIFMFGIAQKIFGSVNDRKLKPFRARVQQINSLEPVTEALSDDALRARTGEFRQKIANGAPIDDILPEAFATVREAAKRSIGLRHFDTQLIGGMVMHAGNIAEMRTGEGKTLVATAPTYLNALEGKGVHVITVNDYLAQRDAEWMGQVYNFLGLSWGTIVHGMDDNQRREAYAADITYGTNNEFGFDYLRDNMKYSLADMVQRGHRYCIVDEVDSILIDESRTPLIISGPTDDRSELYMKLDAIIPHLVDEDFEIDEKQKSVVFTEDGNERLEELLTQAELLEGSMYEPSNVSVVHHANQALRAHKLFTRDIDYIVQKGEVVLIDEFTGRMMPGRRLSEGLHQAIEAKEKTKIQPENQTLASITFQNYFRLYDKLSGMTGTASTEADEFADIYKLGVLEIPTNKPIQRIDDDDVVYRTAKEKFNAIIEDLADCAERGQPVLVGTVSIEKSELLSTLLANKGVKHQVLNALHHEQEAQIVAQAGVPGAITVATNMAGRGTDIQLGGNLEMRIEKEVAEQQEKLGRELNEAESSALVAEITADIEAKKQQALDAGGLYVLATERHESRRIDNQLRGRTGRQGDPGRSKFFICLEDDLLRIFAADRLDAIMRRLGIEEGEAIIHPWMNKALETSQRRVEQRNFEIRKNLLKYDDVINDQRKAVFEQRIEFMHAKQVTDDIKEMRHQTVETMIHSYMPEKAFHEQWDIDGLEKAVLEELALTAPVRAWADAEGVATEEVVDKLIEFADDAYAKKAIGVGEERMRWIEKQVLLQEVDTRWREHLSNLDQLRSVVHLRGYAQRDPLNEFKSEAFSLFEALLSDMRSAVTTMLMRLQVAEEGGTPPSEITPAEPPKAVTETHIDPQTGQNEMDKKKDNLPAGWERTPRNSACPCGSGKKFKHCCGDVSKVAL
nr:preprotein translocase subunit SecA [Hirschia maritima]